MLVENNTFLIMLSFAGYSEGGAMNGEVPSVPITTLAGLASLTHCKYSLNYLVALMEPLVTELMKSDCLGFTQIIRVFFFNFNGRQSIWKKWVKLIKLKDEYENLTLGRLKNNKMPHNHPNFKMYISQNSRSGHKFAH